MLKSDKIYVAGHRGMVGSAICRALGWKPEISLEDGIARTVADYRRELKEGTIRL